MIFHLARIIHESRLPQMQGVAYPGQAGSLRLRLEAKMNWSQIRQGRMVLKGTEFPLLQPQSKDYRHFL